MGKNLPNYQTRGLATKACPPNIKQLDYPPTKKAKTMQSAPEFHIAVNLATPGVGASALQGTCVVSGSPIPQVKLASTELTPVASHPEHVTKAESFTAPDPRPAGRSAYIPKARTHVLEMLLVCANAGRVPSACEILTWMDAEHPQVHSHCADSYSDLLAFGIEDAFDIMETEVCFLATFGDLGHDGATLLRQYTRDFILIPLGLWTIKAESTGYIDDFRDARSIIQWRDNVDDGYVEDAEEKAKVEVEEVEEVEVSNDSDIEEIEEWEVNVGQWEKEL